jgi:cation diffusion facilitator family transporter
MTGPRDEGARVTYIGAVINLLLGIAKTLVGYFAGSRALLADGVHSLTDLVSDVVVLVSFRVARTAPDRDHPYGHGRVESIGSAILGLVLLSVAVGILWDAVMALFSSSGTQPAPEVLILAAASIVLKEVLYRITVQVGRRTNSELLIANAWHHRSDALTSVATFIGVGGAVLGVLWFDAAAAVLVAVMVGAVAAGVLRNAVQSLIDTALPEHAQAAVRKTIVETEGVIVTHALLTRRFGRGFYASVDIEVEPTLSVVDGHEIAEAVRKRVLAEHEDALDITIHVDPWPAKNYDP